MKIIIAILIFGILVLIHELGHFILARINGIEVLDFSIGMGPRLCGFKAFGTQFSIRLLPIGGACMMLGEDQDQNMDNEHSFYAKNVWQRVAVLFAGPGFNFILAFVFALFIIGSVGYDPATVTGISPDGPAAAAGMLEGDVVTKIDGSGVTIGRDIQSYFLYNELTEDPLNVTVKRNGEKVKLTLVPEAYDKYMLGFTYNGTEASTAEVLEVSAGYPMAEAGLLVGDIITKVGDTEVNNGGELMAFFDKNPLTAEPIEVVYTRNGETITTTVTPKYVSSGYSLGFSYNLARVDTNAWETIRYAATEVRYWITDTFKGLGKLFTGKLKSNEVGSVVAIVDLVGDTYEEAKEEGAKITILSLLNISVWLSASLGVMNLLPIPALDGGKLLFCVIEIVRGKPVDREKEGMVHFIGMILLLLLMVFLIFNDVKNIFFAK